jgi:hypothetical protein
MKSTYTKNILSVLFVITWKYADVLVTYCKQAQHCLIAVRAGCPFRPARTAIEHAVERKANADIDILSALPYAGSWNTAI